MKGLDQKLHHYGPIFNSYQRCLLKHLENLNKIKGVIIKDINLTHLPFADDILLFVQDNVESIKNLQFTIHLFEAASSLNINLIKTSISPINVNKERSDKVAKGWGINTIFLPITYLGMPLGGKPRTSSF
ncbi:LINE-1 retrotransposable element ORF2 protein [Cucumis melo var. makuwa]|uniref:LINE-1 retrotransposable element ORF2 protein n=1 Tax=Cucumis melo var. makuwa TaxID=1194695 RepID=A0A5D3BF46_CUCMM|nr:LINE-1 retrotransposable element ORF2 protein [Cucumis melo var. makuwa]